MTKNRRDLVSGYALEEDTFPEGVLQGNCGRLIELLRGRGYSVRWWRRAVQIDAPRGNEFTENQARFVQDVFVEQGHVECAIGPVQREDRMPPGERNARLLGGSDSSAGGEIDQSERGPLQLGPGFSQNREHGRE